MMLRKQGRTTVTAVSYHDTINDLHGLGLSGKGPFADADWFRLLEQSGHRPLYAVAKGEKGAVCLPLSEHADGLEGLTNWYAFTWSPLTSGDPAFANWQALADDLAAKAHRVVLPKMALGSSEEMQLVLAMRRAGWVRVLGPFDTNHYLEVRGRTFAEYLADRPGQLRTTLKRKAKRVEIVLKRQFDASDWAIYEEIYSKSWKPEEGDPALLRAFAERQSAEGHYLFGMALADGEPVAAQFWTVEEGTAYIHKLAHRESAKPLSPGTTLTAALLEEVIDRDKVTAVDFGTGDDAYKADWMEEKRARATFIFLRPGNPRNWPAIAKWQAKRLFRRRKAGRGRP